MADEPVDEAGKRKKDRGTVGKLLFKVGERIGIVEQTRLAPEFVTEIEKYYNYQESIDKFVEVLESVLQNNPAVLAQGRIECEEKLDPLELYAKNIKMFRPFMPHDKQASTIMVEAILKRLAIMRREMQVKGRRAIRKMRRFVAHESLLMIDEQKRLMQTRDIMDAARHDLKQTRTTDQVEEKGKYYERTVHEFDKQAAKVSLFPEGLPKAKINHQLEVFDYFEAQAQFHQKTSTVLAEHLAKLVPKP